MNRRKKKRLTITLDGEVLKLVDHLIDGKRIRNRSHAIEYVLNQELKPKIEQAVILASGKGLILEGDKEEFPKAMLWVRGKPLLEHTLEVLKKSGVKNCLIVITKKAISIKKYFSDGKRWGLKIKYIEEKVPSGTAGPLRLISKMINKDKPFLVVYSDVWAEIDLRDLAVYHKLNQGVATVALTTIKDGSGSGVAKLRGAKIVDFIEKPGEDFRGPALVNAGFIICEKEILKSVPSKKKVSLERDVLEKLAKEGKVFGYPFEGEWYDVGDNWTSHKI
jgi:mannose-1-phosphate guanylyltransferase